MEHNKLPPNDGSSSRATLEKKMSSAAALIYTRNRAHLADNIVLAHQKLLISRTHLTTLLRFGDNLAYIQAQLTAYATFVARYAQTHPGEVLFALLCMVCIATVPVILPAAGFASTGPVAGTLAAIWQSAISVVAAGSPFAIVQSAAMGGVAGTVITGVGAAGLFGLAAKKVGEWGRERWGKKDEKEGKNEKEE